MSSDITIEFATEGVRRAVRQFERVREKLEDIGITGERVSRIGRAMRRGVTRAAKGLAIGLGAAATAAGALAKSAVGVASRLEQARIKFDSLFGSVEEGKQALSGLRDLAAQVPVTFEQLLESAQGLASVVEGPREMIRRLRQLVELSARFPISLREATSNFIRFWQAGAGAADLFREKGVNAALGVQAGMETTVEESRKLWDQFFQQIEESGTSATDRLAKSFQGITSMLEDAWFQLRAQIAQAGLFDATKKALEGLRQSINDFIESGQAQAFAREFTNALAMMVAGIQGLVNVVVQVDDVIRDSFLGRLFGMERGPAGRAAQAEERLQTLKRLQSDLQGGASLGNILPRFAQTGRAFIEPPEGMDRRAAFRAQLQAAIADQRNVVDRLTDKFLEADNLLRTFNETMDRLIRTLQSGGQPTGGGGGGGVTPGGLGITGGMFGPGSARIVDTLERAGMAAAQAAPKIQELGEETEGLAIKTDQAADSADQSFNRIADVAITGMGQAVQAAIQGFDNIAQIVISTVQQIVQSLARKGGPLSGLLGGFGVPLISAGLGILGAVIGGGRDSRPQPVSIEGQSEPVKVREEQEMGPQLLTVQFVSPETGDVMDEVQYQLNRRESRDATQRLPGAMLLSGA